MYTCWVVWCFLVWDTNTGFSLEWVGELDDWLSWTPLFEYVLSLG